MIISVGYRVKSLIATYFRIWATERLKEYIVKGFTMDDERLKNPPVAGSFAPDYFDEMLERIRDIRASERRMYLRVREIFAMAADYEPSLTASGEYGLIDQSAFFNRSVAGHHLKDYYLLKKGEFAYNRSSMKNYPYGAIKRLDRYEEGILSTLYICFSITNNHGNSNYFRHLFESGLLNRQLRTITQVGSRAHGLLNVALKDFLNIKVPQPSHEEQVSIAEVLSSADNEINQLEKNSKPWKNKSAA
jgi:hypothetical protein